MFKMVTGGNGRSVYCGTVAQAKEVDGKFAFELKGTDYDRDARAEVEHSLQLFLDSEIQDSHKDIAPGDILITSVMPNRKNPKLGVAEEVARENQAVVITNDKGNEKVVMMGRIRSKKWNEKHTLLRISFQDIKDCDGDYIGYEVESQDQYGTYKTHWLTASLFAKNDKVKTYYTAEKADHDLNIGDKVVMILTKKASNVNGKTYTNYNCSKFLKPEQ